MSQLNNLEIYYFTGTGNSGKVAKWFAESASEENIPSKLINIDTINRKKPGTPSPQSSLLFISPVHGFNYPPIMMHFMMRFPKGNNKVVLMNTRAGMRIGSYITPGLSGISFLLASLILKLKGYKIQGMRPVDMPSNWISVHPGLNTKAIRFLHIRNKQRVQKFAKIILSGKKSYKALYEIVQDVAIAPISLLYYAFGRFALSKMYFASHHCNNCGLCVKNCPVEAIKWVQKRPFWTINCESCMKCVGSCPTKAIETAHGSLTAFFILYFLVLGLFYKYFELFFFKIENSFILFLIKWVIPIVFLIIWYRITHYLLRFRFFERIMVYTSLTKYKFWGRRYKALKEHEY